MLQQFSPETKSVLVYLSPKDQRETVYRETVISLLDELKISHL